MKAIVVKSLALVTIIAFAAMLVPQQADGNPCNDAQLACDVANIVAGYVCMTRPDWCDFAEDVASAICNWADRACN